jgi:hypothetical protein
MMKRVKGKEKLREMWMNRKKKENKEGIIMKKKMMEK